MIGQTRDDATWKLLSLYGLVLLAAFGAGYIESWNFITGKIENFRPWRWSDVFEFSTFVLFTAYIIGKWMIAVSFVFSILTICTWFISPNPRRAQRTAGLLSLIVGVALVVGEWELSKTYEPWVDFLGRQIVPSS